MYETTNENRIAKLHPKVARLARNWLKQVTDENIPVLICQGLRTIAEQDALYAQGRTTPGNIVTQVRGGYSYHNYGVAFDFCLVDDGGGMNWNVDSNWIRAAEIGKELGFDWGGDWESFRDYPHLEYTFGLTTTQLRNGAQLPDDDYNEENEPMTTQEREDFENLRAIVQTQGEKIEAMNSNELIPAPEWAQEAAEYYGPHMSTKTGSYDFWRITVIQYRKDKGITVE